MHLSKLGSTYSSRAQHQRAEASRDTATKAKNKKSKIKKKKHQKITVYTVHCCTPAASAVEKFSRKNPKVFPRGHNCDSRRPILRDLLISHKNADASVTQPAD